MDIHHEAPTMDEVVPETTAYDVVNPFAPRGNTRVARRWRIDEQKLEVAGCDEAEGRYTKSHYAPNFAVNSCPSFSSRMKSVYVIQANSADLGSRGSKRLP